MGNINAIAADWWAERFELIEKRNAFRDALLKLLPEGDWKTHSDYDPKGELLQAVQSVIECHGILFSSDGLLPRKTRLHRRNTELWAKEGYAGDWKLIYREV